MNRQGDFAADVEFLKANTELVVLREGDAAVAVAPAYQGRVMTSSYNAQSGPSFGWINRPVIERGFLPPEETAGKLEEHIYVFGGEERFWLGPEGGQFSLYFKPGAQFEFADWKTPAVIDTEAFEIVEQTESTAKFQHACQLQNFSGTHFAFDIERTVTVLADNAASELLTEFATEDLCLVGYETDNRITNTGSAAWTTETGLLSIWMLGMYKPSPATTVVIPFVEGSEEELGPRVNDDYFGKVPPEHLRVTESTLFFRGDGTRRGKIGISPQRTKGIAGSYDAQGRVLTILTYNQQPAPNGYVNSAWELQEEPFAGDVINAYNDGSPEPGAPPLGPFYELESSSPAAALGPGETMQHLQQTWHLHGSESDLDPIAKKLLGAGIDEIKAAF